MHGADTDAAVEVSAHSWPQGESNTAVIHNRLHCNANYLSMCDKLRQARLFPHQLTEWKHHATIAMQSCFDDQQVKLCPSFRLQEVLPLGTIQAAWQKQIPAALVICTHQLPSSAHLARHVVLELDCPARPLWSCNRGPFSTAQRHRQAGMISATCSHLLSSKTISFLCSATAAARSAAYVGRLAPVFTMPL